MTDNKKAPQPIKEEGLDGEPVSGVTHCCECGKEISQKEAFDFERDDNQPRCAECAGKDIGLDTVDESLEQFIVDAQTHQAS